MGIERNCFTTMHHQAAVHFDNFTEVKFRDILLTGTGHQDTCLTFWVPGLPPFFRTLESYNLRGDWARELSKPSTDSPSLVADIEKHAFRFRWGISGGDVI